MDQEDSCTIAQRNRLAFYAAVDNLGKRHVRAILRMPFIIDSHIYFSALYIPELKVSIERGEKKRRKVIKNASDKEKALCEIGVKTIYIPIYKLSDIDLLDMIEDEIKRDRIHALSIRTAI